MFIDVESEDSSPRDCGVPLDILRSSTTQAVGSFHLYELTILISTATILLFFTILFLGIRVFGAVSPGDTKP